MDETNLVKTFCENNNIEIKSLSPLRVFDRAAWKEIKPKSFDDLITQVQALRTRWLDEFK